jgi:anti-sigma regulatory factor (Ser/Thr protein kinase)
MSDTVGLPALPMCVHAERVRLSIPSLPHWIEPTVDYLHKRALLAGAVQERRSRKLMVALHEAITNAVIHGNLEVESVLKEQAPEAFAERLAKHASDEVLSSRLVEIVVDFDGETCHWIITDEGKGFDVERVVERCMNADPEIQLASGRGILMMKSFLDDVRFEHGGRRVILSLSRASGLEKRKDERIAVAAPFRVTPLLPDGQPDWGSSYEATSRNFSENGIAILQKHLTQSQQILIGIPTSQGVMNFPAEIKHSRAFGESGVELGCRFLDSPPPTSPAPETDVPSQRKEVEQAITHFLASHSAKQAPPHDRRTHPRMVFNERVAIYVENRAQPLVGYARDLSKGGVALIAQEAVPGDITISLAVGPDHEELRVRCRVLRCQCIQNGFYDIGAAFLHLASTAESLGGVH